MFDYTLFYSEHNQELLDFFFFKDHTRALLYIIGSVIGTLLSYLAL